MREPRDCLGARLARTFLARAVGEAPIPRSAPRSKKTHEVTHTGPSDRK